MADLAPRTPPLQSRLPQVGTTIFTLMSALAHEHRAVNLGQGFPDFDCDPALVDHVSAAMREGLKKAGAKLLEPIMKVEVVTPEEYTGGIIGDLTSRRGMVQGQDTRGNANVINAFVPLANMFGYVNELRSFSQGRANYSMQFSHYDEVPANVAAEVKEKLA